MHCWLIRVLRLVGTEQTSCERVMSDVDDAFRLFSHQHIIPNISWHSACLSIYYHTVTHSHCMLFTSWTGLLVPRPFMRLAHPSSSRCRRSIGSHDKHGKCTTSLAFLQPPYDTEPNICRGITLLCQTKKCYSYATTVTQFGRGRGQPRLFKRCLHRHSDHNILQARLLIASRELSPALFTRS
jgi:hypothetical protein